MRGREGACHHLRSEVRRVQPSRPLQNAVEGAPAVDLLDRVAGEVGPIHLTDQHDERNGLLRGNV